MPDETQPVVELRRALAQVFVTDFARSLAFYRNVLGFEVVYEYGEPAFYAEVERDRVALNLRHVDATPFEVGARDAGQLLSAGITTTDAEALFLEYQDAGADFHEPLREKPWSAIEFVVRDPDGNLLLFGSPTDIG